MHSLILLLRRAFAAAAQALKPHDRRALYWTMHYACIGLYVLFALFPLYLAAQGGADAERAALQRRHSAVAIAHQPGAFPLRARAQRVSAVLPQQPDRVDSTAVSRPLCSSACGYALSRFTFSGKSLVVR